MRRAALLAVALAAVVAGAACDRREPAKAPPAPDDAPAAAPQAASDARPTYEALGERPVNPRRATPPPAMSGRALAVGATAPAVQLPATTGAFDLGEALKDKERVLLVFYRGDW